MLNEILFVVILVVSNILQGLTGFGGAPLAMSGSIPLVGADSAKAVVTFMFFIAPMFTALKNFKYINKKVFLIMIAFMAVGVVAGQFIYGIIPAKTLMIAYGAVVVLIGVIKFLVKTDKALPKPWNYVALVFAGLMQGIITSGGPFLVLYATGELKDKNEFRATVSAIWAVLNTYIIITMLIGGMYTAYEGTLAAIAVLPVIAAAIVSEKIVAKINVKVFLKIVYGLLILSGAVLIMNGLMQ